VLRATDADEIAVNEKAMVYLQDVVLNTKTIPLWKRKLDLGIFSVLYGGLLASSGCILLGEFVHNVRIEGAVLVSVTGTWFLSALFLIALWINIALSKKSRKQREAEWFCANLPDDEHKTAYLDQVRKAFTITGLVRCRQPLWILPMTLGNWMDLGMVVVIGAVAACGILAFLPGVKALLIPAWILLLLGLFAGIPQWMFLAMRTAPWDGIARGVQALPLCLLLNQLLPGQGSIGD